MKIPVFFENQNVAKILTTPKNVHEFREQFDHDSIKLFNEQTHDNISGVKSQYLVIELSKTQLSKCCVFFTYFPH